MQKILYYLQYSSIIKLNHMKKAIIFTIITSICFSACKKSSVTAPSLSPYYVKATINGEEVKSGSTGNNVVYNNYTGALKTNGTLTVYGYAGNALNADGFNFYFQYLNFAGGTVGIDL